MLRDKTVDIRKDGQHVTLNTDEIVNLFHQVYWYSYEQTWQNTYWRGYLVAKCPLDLWIYQEILHQVKPDLIIECGTFAGGSALYFANLFDLMDNGRVITIDIHKHKKERPQHPRIEYMTGSSVADETVAQVKRKINPEDKVLVVLDSDHKSDHVLKELECYHEFVSNDSYLIVEDSNINGHPVFAEHGPGPMEALQAFLPRHPEFRSDLRCEKFFMTQNPLGYLYKSAKT